MPRIIHVVPTRYKREWLVRTDGVADVRLAGEASAQQFGRVVAQRLANRLRQAVVLRLWTVFDRFRDEIFEPAPDPMQDHDTRLKRRAA